MNSEKKYWFPAKRYGWGWGLPTAWQGWLTLVIFLSSITALQFLLKASTHLLLHILVAAVLIAAFFLVCWLKGEPPKWRWGKGPDE